VVQRSGVGHFEKNDRQLNNTFFGGGTRRLQQDVNDYQAQISKFGITGGEYALRNKINYDNNNAPGNAFPHAYTDELEAEIRHPLLQGAGAEFNRLAGPSRTPGLVNGVMIARVNNKITQADFELALRNYVSNVENAYWDLYFAYRNLDAKIQARDRALETWRIVRALQKEDRRGGEADKEALAREQYYRFQEEVQNALTGRQEDGTRTNNGSTGGAFRGTGGVHIAERRLRLLMGVPINENRLVRPTDEPEMARIVLDWDSIVTEAHARRTELKRQRLLVERREMELLANRNFLAPRLDAVGLYRWRGFGRDLVEQGGNQNAIDDLTGGAFQEWQLGVQLDVPIGFRRAHAAVQNSELLLAKDRAILREQERQIGHDLSNAIGEVDRSYEICQTNLNRYRAARKYLDTLEANRKAGRPVDVDKILDAQNRVAASETRYFLTRVEYALAIKNINFEKGSLLEYHDLFTEDGIGLAKNDKATAKGNIATANPQAEAIKTSIVKTPVAKTPVVKSEQPAATANNASPIRPASATKDAEEKPLFDMISDGPFSLD
jgi:outer membrane protein TolC